ncbi:MAG: universal stress protein [Geminicoccaceae bacterium]|nr:MAG: universal stress protein [Geminicoccaceae bacterium]
MVETILLPVDVSKASLWKKSIDTAIELARQHGAKLHVLYVVPKLERNLARLPEHHKPELEKFMRAVVPDDVKATSELKAGTKHREICRAAERVKADLIVMGSHNPKMTDVLLGSHASSVVLNAPCSVYVVR